jgi:hypothetical protein
MNAALRRMGFTQDEMTGARLPRCGEFNPETKGVSGQMSSRGQHSVIRNGTESGAPITGRAIGRDGIALMQARADRLDQFKQMT